jgi:predicted MFS family arabinose efflux permease
MTTTPAVKLPSERMILFLVGAIQFVNILDFMMVMPLGPDLSVGLGIASSHLGYIGGAYTASAAVSGIVASFFLDRFDRRSALAVAMFGLVLGTAAGGFATGLGTLMLARVVAGAFGGPATSLALSIVADVIPPERRGKAMGAVMGAFSIASVLGVPMGLQLSQWGSWRTPFFAVAGVGLAVTAGAIFLMPSLRLHLERSDARHPPPFREVLGRPVAQLSLLTSAAVMLATFTIVPNLATYVQFNLGYPRERLGLLYLVGGVVSFIAMRFVGGLVDRLGAPKVAAWGTGFFVSSLVLWILLPGLALPVMGFYILMMLSNSGRSVAMSALTSRVPRPLERARFTSLQSSVQHIASAIGAFLSASLLVERPDHGLEGMSTVALVSIGFALTQPVLLWFVAKGVRVAEAETPRAQPIPVAAAME